MNSHHAGDVVTLTIFRGQKRMDVKVTLGDAKDQQSQRGGEQTYANASRSKLRSYAADDSAARRRRYCPLRTRAIASG